MTDWNKQGPKYKALAMEQAKEIRRLRREVAELVWQPLSPDAPAMDRLRRGPLPMPQRQDNWPPRNVKGLS